MRWPWVIGLVVGMLASSAPARAEPGPEIEDTGALVIVIDRALPAAKLDVIADALGDALGRLPSDQRLGVVAAGRTATVTVRLGRVDDANRLDARVRTIRPQRKTNLLAAMRAAGAQLDKVRHADRAMLVITDGDELLSLEPTMRSLRRQGITVSALGLESLSRTTLTAIASRGEGKLYLVDTRRQVADAIFETAIVRAGRSLAVVLVIDRSAAMQDAPLEAAKELARMTAESLRPSDLLGVIVYDSRPHDYIPLTRAANRMRIVNEIARLRSSGGGGRDVALALQAAHASLAGHPWASRHVILITNGSFSSDGIATLVTTMRDARTTISAVGLAGADRTLLSPIADLGDGRLYMVDDLAQLPSFFARPDR